MQNIMKGHGKKDSGASSELHFETLHSEPRAGTDASGEDPAAGAAAAATGAEILHQQTPSRQTSAYSQGTKGARMSGNDDEGDRRDKEKVPASRRPDVTEDLCGGAESAGEEPCEAAPAQGAGATTRHGDALRDGRNEDRVATGPPLAPEGRQVGNEVGLGGSESDEDTGYFQKGPQGDGGMNMQGNCLPEDEDERANERGAESDDSTSKGEEIGGGEADSPAPLSPREDGGRRGDGDVPDFPARDLERSLEELESGDDTAEAPIDRVKDFTGDDHQEAGETFAEFPREFSSWGDDEAAGDDCKPHLDEQLSPSSEISYLGRETEPTLLATVNTDNKENQDVCPGWMEAAVDAKVRAFTAGEADNKCQSKALPCAQTTVLPERCWREVGDEIGACLEDEDNTEDEAELKGATYALRSPSGTDLHNLYDYTCARESIFDIRPQTIRIFGSSGDEIQAYETDVTYNRDDLSQHESAPAMSPPPLQNRHDEMSTIHDDSSLTKTYSTWEALNGGEDDMWANMHFLSQDSASDTEDEGKQKSWPSLASAASEKSASTKPFNTDARGCGGGCVDDDFFFTREGESSGIAELCYYDDDEYETRNWDKEQERIQAFYAFYNDSNGEIDEGGRKTKVHFCTDPLPQVIHYDSEEGSFSSSTEAEEETNAAHNEMSESDAATMNSNLQLKSNVVPENVAGLRNTQLQTRKNKCLLLLNMLLKILVVIGMGLLVLWWSMDEADFLGLPLFKA